MARRLQPQALWLVRTGASVAAASQIAGVGQRSVERWLGWCRQGGLAEALRRVPGHGARGQPSYLSAEQQQALVAQVASGAFRTDDEARQWVAVQFGVRYSDQGKYAVLARLQVHPKVPRPTAAKADPNAQAAWKRGLAAALSEAGVSQAARVLQGDELRLGLHGQVRRVLAPKGVKVVERVQIEERWRSLLLGVDPRTGTLTWRWLECFRQKHLKPVLADWDLAGVNWDGAGAHRGKQLPELPTARIFLPPYSPELNPAERILEEIRRRVEGRVDDSLDD